MLYLASWSLERGLTTFLIIPGAVIVVPALYAWYLQLRKVHGRQTLWYQRRRESMTPEWKRLTSPRRR